MKRFDLLVVSAVLAGMLVLAACSSPPPGPVQPEAGPQAPGVLVIDPALQPYLDVPNGEQYYSYNDLGFLEYNTRVRNKGSKSMTLRIVADFQDERGALTEEHSPIRFFIDPDTEKPLQIAANNKKSRKMRIQIHVAR
jgi:hypothetical protein